MFRNYLVRGGDEMPILTKDHIQLFDHYVALQTASPMKVVSSAMHNPGFGHYTHLMNRTVPITYDERQPHQELQQFLQAQGFPPHNTVAMMTAVQAQFATIRDFTFEGIQLDYCGAR